LDTTVASSVNEGDLVAGRYRLLRPIGSGAMGTVWAARHELLGRDFALKLATVSARAGPEVRARFLREARIVAKLRHPNVVDVVDVADVGGGGPDAGLYLAMELLEGQSLAQRIDEHGPFEPAAALAIVSEVCRGLAAAHAAGVVHRDIKPENIFLARGPSGGIVPKLLDFGISKAAEAGEGLVTLGGQLFGTPAYMSPEQAIGEIDIDHRTDVWSLGVVLYEMLTGKRPFAAESYPALLARIADEDYVPLPPSVPPEVQAIIGRCLAKPREDRYPSADALRAALDAARGIPAGQSVRPSGVERSRVLPSFRPHPPGGTSVRRALLLGGIAVALAASAAAWWISRETPAPFTPPPVAEQGAPPPSVNDVPAIATDVAAPIEAPLPRTASSASERPKASTPVHPKATASASPPQTPSGGKSVTKVNSAGF